MEIQADYFDGKSSRRHSVRFRLETNGGLVLIGLASEDLKRRFEPDEVTVEPRLGNAPRRILLPDGALLETPENDAVDRALGGGGKNLHALERRWRYAFLALAIAIAFAWGGVRWGIPALAETAAFALPEESRALLGDQALAGMDKTKLFRPSHLPKETKDRLAARFFAMEAALKTDEKTTLAFRRGKGRIGANAFALPGGVIVMTDALVDLAENDDEVMAILAHELGHHARRHALRQLLQNSLAALFVAAMAGDVFSLSGLSGALPTLMLQTGYTRDFEREADRFALEALKTLGLPPRTFAAILSRLVASQGGARGLSFLRTHPHVEERIKAFE